MYTSNKNNQFKTLIQNELNRLEAIVNENSARTIYPVSQTRYTQKKRSSALLARQPSTYHGFMSFARMARLFTF